MSSYNIYLTSKWDSAADGIWTSHSGEVLYKTVDPWTSSTVTIERAVPGQAFSKETDPKTIQYTTLATLKFRDFHSDQLTFGGTLHKEDEFFKKGSMFPGFSDFFNWGRDRIFTGPDGVEYAWKLKKKAVELHLNDDTKTQIAVFHPKKSSLMGMRTGEPAYLEIMPQGQSFIDLIFITFIYNEKLRYDREVSQAVGKLGTKIGGAM